MTCMLYRLDDLKNVKCELKALINEKIVLILMLMMVMVMVMVRLSPLPHNESKEN